MLFGEESLVAELSKFLARLVVNCALSPDYRALSR
jgi:hypothetical protein